MRARAQDLGRPDTEQHVFELHLLPFGNRLRDVTRRGERIAPSAAECVAHGAEDRLAGAERVLVAAQDDHLLGGRERLLEREERGLTAARANPGAGGARADRLNEAAA